MAILSRRAAAFALALFLTGCASTAEIRKLEEECVKEMAEGSKKPAIIEKAEKLCADRYSEGKKEAFETDVGGFFHGVTSTLGGAGKVLLNLLIAL